MRKKKYDKGTFIQQAIMGGQNQQSDKTWSKVFLENIIKEGDIIDAVGKIEIELMLINKDIDSIDGRGTANLNKIKILANRKGYLMNYKDTLVKKWDTNYGKPYEL